MQLRKIAAVLVSTLMVGSVFAGGPDMMAPAPAHDWAGYYAGIDMGGAWAHENYAFNNIGINGGIFQSNAGGSLNQSISGFVGGVFVGKSWQRNNWLWGLETGIDGSTLSGTVQNVVTGTNGTATTQNKANMNWFYTLTPRLGYACHHWLFFGKLGAVATDLHSKITTNGLSAPNNVDDEDHYALGLDVGAGVNYKINRWILGVGYDFLYFGTTDFGQSDTNFTGLSYGLENKVNEVKASVGYQFNT